MDDREEGQQASTEVDHHGGPLSEVFGPPESEEQQQTLTEVDCHGGPISEVSGPPEATASLARGGLPLQVRHQRRLQPPSGTLSLPTDAISDSAFEEWLHSDKMEVPTFSLSEEQRQQPPTRTAITVAAVVTGTRVFPAVSSKGVAKVLASSAGAASAAVPAAAAVLFSPLRRWGGQLGRPLLQMERH